MARPHEKDVDILLFVVKGTELALAVVPSGDVVAEQKPADDCGDKEENAEESFHIFKTSWSSLGTERKGWVRTGSR